MRKAPVEACRVWPVGVGENVQPFEGSGQDSAVRVRFCNG